MKNPTLNLRPYRLRTNALLFSRLLVLAASAGLLALITIDTLQNRSFIADNHYIHAQFWVCMVFLFNITLECALSQDKLKYLLSNLFFLLVSIPYLSVISHYHIPLNDELQYVLRFVPILRTAYVLALVTGVFTASKLTSMFTSYIALLITTLYLGSLMFFIAEHPVNPEVRTYWSSLWWAIMDMTTTGSSISPVTSTGKALGVIMSTEGLILFPVFTVYITNALTRRHRNDSVAD